MGSGQTGRWVAAALLIASLAGAGCGDGGGSATTDTTTTTAERTDAAARLPHGWRRVVNRAAGFTLGIPPGWTARGGHGATLIRSADRALAISVTADRSAQGRTTKPVAYVRETLRSLAGYRSLGRGKVRPLTDLRYPAASGTTRGTFVRTHVRQAIVVIALARPGQVMYSLLLFRSARAPESRYDADVQRVVRSFRARPPATS